MLDVHESKWFEEFRLAWHALLVANRECIQRPGPHSDRILIEQETHILTCVEEASLEDVERINDLLWG